VIIGDLNFIGISRTPDKANTPLVVDTDAVLPSAVAVQPFETVPRRGSEIAQDFRGIQLPKFAKRYSLDVLEALDRLPSMKLLRVLRAKGLNHVSILYCRALNVNRYRGWEITRFAGVLAHAWKGLRRHPSRRLSFALLRIDQQNRRAAEPDLQRNGSAFLSAVLGLASVTEEAAFRNPFA
jgi:hypothetical protein